MISIASVKAGEKTCLGVRVDLPDSPPLLLILGEKGFVMCGFLNVEAAEKVSAAAAMVSGVKTFEDVLNAEVKAGMRGADALKRMC
jgi:uncharacterized protein YunC (DUF1805 family)